MSLAACDFLVVLCTCASLEEGRRVARDLVENKLAACVNLVSGVESLYRWRGAVETAAETLLIVKTTAARFGALRARILEIHGYDVPEVVAVPIAEGSPAYLSWLTDQVGGPGGV